MRKVAAVGGARRSSPEQLETLEKMVFGEEGALRSDRGHLTPSPLFLLNCFLVYTFIYP
jgi:hypothetical protein